MMPLKDGSGFVKKGTASCGVGACAVPASSQPTKRRLSACGIFAFSSFSWKIGVEKSLNGPPPRVITYRSMPPRL